GLEAVSRGTGGICVSAGRKAGRWVFFVPAAELHNPDRQYWIRDGRAVGGGAAALRHGPQRRAPQGIFRQDRSEAADSRKQRDLDRRDCPGRLVFSLL